MKKLLAIILAIICAFSTCTLAATALSEDLLGDIFEDQFGITQEKEEADALSYGVHYSSGDLVTVTVLYEPSPTITFEAPTIVTITDDTPVAVDHNWVCWKNKETGELYYPGDKILIDGKVTLVAVWEEKTDNYPSFFRSMIAGVQALLKLVQKFFNVFDVINNSETVLTTAPTTTEIPTTVLPTIYIPE